MNRALLPSVKVIVATLASGIGATVLDGVDWPALIVAVVTLVLSYLFPELNPPASALERAE